MTVYIVIGIRENVYQDEIGGPFISHPDKELVTGFYNQKDAEDYISRNKLAKAKKQSYGDTSYYKDGYYEMEIQEVEVNGNTRSGSKLKKKPFTPWSCWYCGKSIYQDEPANYCEKCKKIHLSGVGEFKPMPTPSWIIKKKWKQ